MLKYLLPLSFMLFSCKGNTQVPFESNELKSYFKTDNISATFDKSQRRLNIKIVNSELLNEKQKKMGNSWVNAEAWASVAATQIIDDIKVKDVDSVRFQIEVGGSREVYAYSVEDVQNAIDFFNKSRNFIFVYTQNGYEKAKPFLAETITAKMTDAELKNLLSTAIPENSVDTIEFAAFKQGDGTVSIYFNVYYTGLGAQTYIFAYMMNGNDNRIVGINVP